MAAEGGPRRTIGEIVLGLGFVTDEELAAAVETQELTGKPLGQILVEAGSITRLELASALAEQWSSTPDTSTALLDLRADTSQLLGPGAIEGLEGHVSGLAERLEATLRRTTELDAALVASGESIGVVAGQLERLEGRVEALADESALEAVREAVEALARRPLADPGLAERLDAIEREVTLLAAHPASDPELGVQVTELAATIATEAEGRAGEIAGLRDAIAHLEQAASRDAALAARVDEVAALVAALRGELDAETASADARAEVLQEVHERLDTMARRMDELTARPAADPVLPERMATLERRLGEEVAALDEVRRATGELAARPAADPALVEELAAVTRRVEEFAAREEPVAGGGRELSLEIAVGELGARLAALEDTAQSAPAATETGPTVPESIESELERILMAIERLGLHIGEHDRALAEMMRARGTPHRLDELAARIDDLAAGAAGTPAEGGAAAGAASAGSPALSRRVQQLEAAVSAEREQLLTRIERVASSLEWRLQRLEGAGDGAATRPASLLSTAGGAPGASENDGRWS